ncbi:hypothetical protein HIM_11634 [Hirsutella minnesotensis 3608]|uniref:DNA-directed RNA polymerase n=1 Tax=Hirsutella minnesotensis 3608 TaxID=1043627 RepID=A0A0F7ZWH4_9HYPO|nr:hypothetical protein HIM_11634 [Hirsutella minnesotensis 3608]
MPLSVHTHHAWLECSEYKDATKTLGVYSQPQETTSVPGVLGTIHNCQLVDLAQEEDDETADIPLRETDLDDYDGFLCRGHTAHSLEAGRMTMCSLRSLMLLRNFLASTSAVDGQTATLEVNTVMHTALLSVSSGVLLRRDAERTVIASSAIYGSRWPDGRYIPTYPDMASPEGFKFYFSYYFQTIPYIAFDRPPRPLIASVQHIQAVAVPYGAGTSSVEPTHVSRPLVTTPFMESIIDSSTAGIPDNMPGEDLVVCFANLNDTYEDSVVLSKASAARGLFNHMAYSANVVNSTETIPEVGQKVHIKTNRWWKTYATKHVDDNVLRQAEMEHPGGRLVMADVDGRGKVISKSITASGQVSVKMLRFSMPATGDKIATGHGQKGTMKLWEEQDMPYGVDENGEVVKFDMIMSLSSVVNRLTEGQYYEMVSGVRAAREGRRIVVAPHEYETHHTETVLYDGKTGELVVRPDDDRLAGMEDWDGDIPVLASWGICRVWQMTQLTWDKQHYTHGTAECTARPVYVATEPLLHMCNSLTPC